MTATASKRDDQFDTPSETDYEVWDEMLDAPGDSPARAAASERLRGREFGRRLADVQAVFDTHPSGTDVPDVSAEVLRRLSPGRARAVPGADTSSDASPWDRVARAWRAWTHVDAVARRGRPDRRRFALATVGIGALVLGSVLWLPIDAGGLSGAAVTGAPVKPGGILLVVAGVALLVAAYMRGRR
jgi:hypothetical protein